MQDADFSAGLQAENLRTGMKDCRYFYIDGKWVSPAKPRDFIVVNPATEQPIATISLGSAADVEKAVQSTISETGASGVKDMGKVMAALKAKLAGKADMGKVSALVKSKLSG